MESELTKLREQIATQAESLSTCHARMKLQKEAIELGVAALEWAVKELSQQNLAGACYAPVLQKSRIAIKALKNSITPKGEQSS